MKTRGGKCPIPRKREEQDVNKKTWIEAKKEDAFSSIKRKDQRSVEKDEGPTEELKKRSPSFSLLREG